MRVGEMTFLRDHWYPVARLDRPGGPCGPDRPGGTTDTASEADQFRAPGGPVSGRPLLARLLDTPLIITTGDEDVPVVHVLGPDARPGRPLPTRCAYDLLWTCLGDPVSDAPPAWPEATESTPDGRPWRRFVEFFGLWQCSAPRIIDNNLDNTHIAFVHRSTFGDPADARLPRPEIDIDADGRFRVVQRSEQPGIGVQLGVTDDERQRFARVSITRLLAPLTTTIRLHAGGSGPDYSFFGVVTPVDDHRSIYVRLTALAGTEEEQPWAPFHAFGTRVTEEDRFVLETTDPDFPVDITSEVHLRCDAPTLQYRRYLAGLLTAI